MSLEVYEDKSAHAINCIMSVSYGTVSVCAAFCFFQYLVSSIALDSILYIKKARIEKGNAP